MFCCVEIYDVVSEKRKKRVPNLNCFFFSDIVKVPDINGDEI